MAAIPNKRAVSQAIRSVRRTLKQAIKEINQTAADLAKKGDYERAEPAMTTGRELLRFREEIAGVEQKWKQSAGPASRKTKHPAKFLLRRGSTMPRSCDP